MLSGFIVQKYIAYFQAIILTKKTKYFILCANFYMFYSNFTVLFFFFFDK